MTLCEKKRNGQTCFQIWGEVPNLSLCRKFLTPEDETSVFTMDHFPLWYRQAAEQPAGSFVFNLRSAEGPGNLYPCAPGAELGPGRASSCYSWWETKADMEQNVHVFGFPSNLPS